MVVRQSREGEVAIVTIDNPPVNALGHAVREGLVAAFERSEADPEIRAVVLHCAGRTFAAGADIREFGQPPVPPSLGEVLRRLERGAKPWIAAIHGSALGGGLELALACRFRIAAPGAKLGFPEVTLGLIPGAGGSVLLPRLVAADTALEMIGVGKPVAAEAALRSGLVDAVAEADLLDAALRFAREALSRPLPPPVVERAVRPDAVAGGFEAVAGRIEARAGGQEAPRAAVQALRDSLTLPAEQALAAEGKVFRQLRQGAQSRALRHIFLAERAAARIDRIAGVAPRPLERIGVIGGGTMGAGIAAACLLAGLTVVMIERDRGGAEAGRARVGEILQGSLKRGLVSAERHAEMLAAFAASDRYGDLAQADLVIEAVFEDMGVKREVFAKLDAATRPEAVLASNTSYLDLNALAAATRDPGRVIGLHFFSPAHIMKLLEVVTPEPVGDQALATGIALARRLGKIPVLAGVCDGFIANRIMSAYRRECEYMLEDGALPWQIDRAMTDFGLPMGVFQMQDLAGLDISWAMRKRQAARRDPALRYVDIGDKLCEQGRLGRKTGRGYYLYRDGRTAEPDPEVEALIVAESARKGIRRVAMSDEVIMSRILAVMQAEGRRIVAEGIARNADDVDVVMVNAYGFPRWKGGPMFMARAEAGAG